MLVQHYFAYSKFKHSREGFNRFFLPCFYLIWLTCLLFLVLIWQRVLKDFLTHLIAEIHPSLSLRIVARDVVLFSFTYTVDFSFFIGTTQKESTINCGGFVDPNYFLFFPSYVTTIQSTRDFFMYSSVYNTLLFDFAM